MKRLLQQLKHPSRGEGTSNWQREKNEDEKSGEDWQKQLYHLSALLFVSGLCKNRTLVSLPGFLAAGEGWGASFVYLLQWFLVILPRRSLVRLCVLWNSSVSTVCLKIKS